VNTSFTSIRSLSIALILVGAAATLGAQSQQSPSRTFEVVSVKPGLSPYEMGRQAAANGGDFSAVSFGIRTFPGGRLTAYANLRTMIARAYEIKDYQIEGAPKWLGEEYFSVEGRAGGDATAAEFNEMLKALLADRFGLRTHASTRQGQVHNLVFTRADRKLGPGLNPTPPDCLAQIEARKKAPETPRSPPPAPPRAAGQPPDMTPRCGVSMGMSSVTGATTMSVSAQPISSLIDSLTADLGSPVIDRTGLEGMFDYVVEYESPRTAAALGGRGGLDPNSTESPRPPLRTAIERQLGLKLESAEGQIPILVIDAAERPKPD
jgi:uncharacterized protein (TIGR03435 family)